VKDEKGGIIGGEEKITITVRSSLGETVQFKVKKTSALSKLFEAYLKKMGLNKTQIVFLFDCQPLDETKTPESFGIEDGDIIDTTTHQVGGHTEFY
jgi:hypothetical protein